MGSEVFEVGLFKPEAKDGEAVMLPRVWDQHALLRSIGWVRHQNLDGRNIYIRPKGEHNLSLVDDLSRDTVIQMKESGFEPALVVETSPGNYQAWLKHPQRLCAEMGTAAARALSEKFGGDRKAADWRHYGRLSGFTNRKTKYLDVMTGLYPFVKLIEATGRCYTGAGAFLETVRGGLEQRRQEEARRKLEFARARDHRGPSGDLKSIEAFRNDSRYGGDGTRIDLAYALYALSHGVTETQVEAAIRSRDLSHKGSERRQLDYVSRTIRKALSATDRGR